MIHTLVIGTQSDEHCIQVTKMWREVVRVVSKANKDRAAVFLSVISQAAECADVLC